jgi:DNA-binding LacI/PurR family transcriptional regulator
MRTVLCIDEQTGRRLKLANILKAAGYVCIVTHEFEHAELSLAMYKIDLIIVLEHIRTKVRSELQKIRDVPLLVVHDKPDSHLPEGNDLVLYDQPDAVLQAVRELLNR